MGYVSVVVTVNVLLGFVIRACAREQASNHADTGDMEEYDSTNQPVKKSVDSLLDRALKVAPFDHTDLEKATLGKSGQLAVSSPTSVGSSTFHRASRAPLPVSVLPTTRLHANLYDSARHGAGVRPYFRREATPAHRNQVMCGVHAREDLGDVNLRPGAVKELTTDDSPVKLAFNEVQVRVYNIDRYGMSPLAAKALNKNIEAIWHVGVAVFGKEYWYGAIVEAQNLTEVDYAFGFGPTHVYNIGTTDVDPTAFHNWVFDTMSNEYQVETYDCFKHNCHHFANDLVVKLTGKTPEDGGFPRWCLDHGENALSEQTDLQAKATSWVSNRIAKVMMISWGKYNRERFVSKGTTSEESERARREGKDASGARGPSGAGDVALNS
jgi:hypothetical protein